MQPERKENVEFANIHHIEPRLLGREYVLKKRLSVCDLLGNELGNIGLAPSVYLHDAVQEMRSAPTMTLDDIHAAITKAAVFYQEDVLAGLSCDDYAHLTQQVTGLPRQVIDQSVMAIYSALKAMPQTIANSIPKSAALQLDVKSATNGFSLQSRRGDTLAVLAAGNGPGLHALWPQAVALGYRCLVRPSNREPFTAQRLVAALERAGLENYVSLCCTDHRGADALIEACDLALVYGGQQTAELYEHNSKVLVQGPGRSKVVVGADADIDEAVAMVARSLSSLGGAACVSTSSVLVEGDTKGFAEKLSKYCKENLSPDRLPKASQAQVNAYRQALEQYPANADFGFETEVTAQGLTIKPYIDYSLNHNNVLRQRELPFPCAAVMPFERQRCAELLKGSLAVSVYSKNQELINCVLKAPDIGNVYVGDIMTTWMAPHVPHDGFLSEFLMQNRGCRIHRSWISSAY